MKKKRPAGETRIIKKKREREIRGKKDKHLFSKGSRRICKKDDKIKGISKGNFLDLKKIS